MNEDKLLNLELGLRQCFEAHRLSSSAPLFQAFDTYLESLPARIYSHANNKILNILVYTHSHLANQSDLEFTAYQLIATFSRSAVISSLLHPHLERLLAYFPYFWRAKILKTHSLIISIWRSMIIVGEHSIGKIP